MQALRRGEESGVEGCWVPGPGAGLGRMLAEAGEIRGAEGKIGRRGESYCGDESRGSCMQSLDLGCRLCWLDFHS